MANVVTNTIDKHKKANQEITATTATVEELYKQTRTKLNKLIETKYLTGKKTKSATTLVALIESMGRVYGEFEEQFQEEMGRAIPYVAEMYYFEALQDIDKTLLGEFDTKRAESAINDAYTHIAGATNNMLKTEVQNLRNVVAQVQRQASFSGMTIKQVGTEIYTKLTAMNSGFKFVDVKGRVWDNKAYCKMLSRTLTLNAGREAYLDTCTQEGIDVVMVTVSGSPCPKCAVWENRLLSITGATEGLPLLQSAVDGGLFHPNCTHSTVAVADYDVEHSYDNEGRPLKGYNSADNPNPPADDKGRPLKGYNSADNPNPPADDKEANREYRKQNKSDNAKPVTPPVLKPNGSPISDKLYNKATNRKLRPIFDDVIETIDLTHGDGDVMSTPISTAKLAKDTDGMFSRYDIDILAGTKISISAKGKYPRISTAHEIGHLIDYSAFGENAVTGSTLQKTKEMQELMKALHDTKAIKNIEKMNSYKSKEITPVFKEYLLREREIFARAYSQYIAEKNKNHKNFSIELDKYRKSDNFTKYHMLWSDEDFEGISDKFDNLFLKKGWLK